MAEEQIKEVMEKVQALPDDQRTQLFIELISNSSVSFISSLSKKLEEKFGISGAVFAGPAVATQPTTAKPQEEERATYDIFLKDIGAKKVEVIKIVKNVTGLGLIDAKNLVEKAPTTIKTTVPKDDALKIKKELETAGATVELK
ncbi:MAG: 50S ribosomal protein L7/L12 [Planctomycetota bacterium]